MDFSSSWYAVHNVLEYFFWFKSRLHFHARVGMVPLGGNTVFMQRRLIERAGGWDDRCLTEDADIGIRISALGKPIAVTYDAEHVTREETPPTLASFVRQRTRWNQGFLQVLRKGDWRRFPSVGQRGLAVYTLMYPFGQAFVGVLWPISVVMIVAVKMPVLLAMLSFIPLYVLGFQLLVNFLGLIEFAAAYRMRLRASDVTALVLGFLPYQFLLSISAVRAVYREFRGMTNWEKTAHTGAHRELVHIAAAVADAGE
jgi:cellulose synthase/poly-beta-1,6-N-acetylglucosamine synthase-like glycosyltransferase